MFDIYPLLHSGRVFSCVVGCGRLGDLMEKPKSKERVRFVWTDSV